MALSKATLLTILFSWGGSITFSLKEGGAEGIGKVFSPVIGCLRHDDGASAIGGMDGYF